MYRFKFLAIILLSSIIFNLTSAGPVPVRAEEDGSSSETTEEITEPPKITTVFPNYGSPGTRVYVLGDNFVKDKTQVLLGSKKVKDLSISSEGTLSFTVPYSLQGEVFSLSIDNSFSQAELPNAFTCKTAVEPEVDSISPNTGGLKGGTPVTIKGSNFRQGVDSSGNPKPPEVKFGEELATSVTVINTGEIVAVAPAALTEGQVTISIRNPDQDEWTEFEQQEINYEYISEGKAIRILNITPDRGTMYGGTPITIRGVNFPTDKEDYTELKILIGHVEVSDISIKPYGYYDENNKFHHYKDENGNNIYIISAVTGSSNSNGDQDVELIIKWKSGPKQGRTEVAVLEEGFTYYNPDTFPEIDDVINTTTGTNVGPIGGGHKIEIKGSGFESGAEVYFGTNRAEVIELIGTSITVELPPGDIAGPVDVIVYNKNAGQVTGQAVKQGGFTYRGTSMRISSVTPNYTTTEERKKVYITGENFDEDIENTIVYFEYVVTDPLTEEETVYQEPFEYVKLASGDGTLLTAWTPKNPASGLKDLVVENSFGRAVLPNEFEVRSPDIEPEIESVLAIDSEEDNPQSPKGPTTGGTRFRIIGDNFVTGSKVYVGDNLATDVDVSFSKIEATSPPGEPGWHSVTVESITGNKATLPADETAVEGKKGFYYYSNPEIVDISPSRGSVDGGNIITITGEQFYPGLKVNFGFENEDGPFTPVASVTEEDDGENEIRLVDNNTIQLRLPELSQDKLTSAQKEELANNGELAVQVQVVNNDQQSTVWSKTFLYKIPDSKVTIDTVTPAIGRVDGGPQVVIRGDNFHPDATVYFGWEKAEIIHPHTDQEIIVTAPPNPEGEYKVTVSNLFDTGTDIWEPFEYFDPGSVPQIEEVFPPMGPVEGGTKITITGVGFWPEAQVWIGGKMAGNVEANYTYITATTPEGDTAGPADVMVVNPDGGTDLLPGGFTYRIPDSDPKIFSVSPNQVPTTGGTIVTIKGDDFRKGVTVYFGTEVAEIVHFIEPDEIVVKAPAYPLGIEATVDVTVLNRDGGVAQSKDDSQRIHYVLPKSEPIIDSIDPDKGPAAGGTLVVISGDGFSSKGVTVYFGGREAQVQSIRYDRLEVITPPGEPGEPVHVTVTNHDPDALGSYTLEKAYTYVASQPVIESVAPNQGTYLGGTLVTITGQSFTTVGAAVYIGEWLGQEVNVIDSETITFVTPPIADSPEDLPELKWWDVKVVNADGVEAVKKEAFRYLYPDSNPEIIHIEPDAGPTVGGLPITIYGTDFRQRAQVVIGGKDAEVLFIDDSSGEGNARIIAKLPPHTPGEKDVVVINYEGAISNTVTFTYMSPLSFPEITLVEPQQGPTLGDTEVIITGIGFKEGESGESPRVWFGMNEAPEVELIDYKTLRVITPPGNEGNVDVLVLNPDMGQAVLENGFRYIQVEEPVIDSVVPNEGTAEGGTEITITGGPFDPEAVVLIGGNPALEVVVEDTSQIKAVTPPGEVGWQEVKVKNSDGGWAALVNGFYYFKPRSAPEAPPEWVDADRKDKETIELRWEPVEFANYYEIWVSTSRNGEYRFLAQTDRTVYYATGLDFNETYYFQIRAVNELGVSDFSYYESARTGSGRQQETELVPEKMIWETANGNATAIIATAEALAYAGYRIDFSQNSDGKAIRRVVRISREALSKAYWPVTMEAPGITLSLPADSIDFGILASDEDYAEIVIADLGQEEAERALRGLPRGSRIISPVYEISGQVLKGIKAIPLTSFSKQVELTLKYSTNISPGNQVSLYTYNPSTGNWVNTGAASDPLAAQLTLGISQEGRFMLVEHR